MILELMLLLKASNLNTDQAPSRIQEQLSLVLYNLVAVQIFNQINIFKCKNLETLMKKGPKQKKQIAKYTIIRNWQLFLIFKIKINLNKIKFRQGTMFKVGIIVNRKTKIICMRKESRIAQLKRSKLDYFRTLIALILWSLTMFMENRNSYCCKWNMIKNIRNLKN